MFTTFRFGFAVDQSVGILEYGIELQPAVDERTALWLSRGSFGSKPCPVRASSSVRVNQYLQKGSGYSWGGVPARLVPGRLMPQRLRPPGYPGSYAQSGRPGRGPIRFYPSLIFVMPRFDLAIYGILKMDKVQLREKMKQERSLLTEQERIDFAQAAAQSLMGSDALLKIDNIGLFASVRDEIDTKPLFEALVASGRQVFFPKMDMQSRALNWGPVDALDSLVKGPYGISEPASATYSVADLGMIVVPGLGFGLNGGRLGYGAGWYDRSLDVFQGMVVGLGYDCQVLEVVPAEEHDQPVHWIVTELRAIPLGD